MQTNKCVAVRINVKWKSTKRNYIIHSSIKLNDETVEEKTSVSESCVRGIFCLSKKRNQNRNAALNLFKGETFFLFFFFLFCCCES